MRTMTSWLATVLLVGSLAACSDDGDGKKSTVRLYAVTYGPEGALVELDPGTGALLREIGPTGFMISGLEYDETTDTLYATTSSEAPTAPQSLLTLDLTTGAGTQIGEGMGATVTNPTVDSTGTMYAWTENGDDLVTIDTETGVATAVADSHISTWSHGLRFAPDGRLFLVNASAGDVYVLDKATGLSTTVNPDTGAPVPLGSLGSYAHHGDFHPDTGEYWGIMTRPDANTTVRMLGAFDLNTRTLKSAHRTEATVHAIAFAP